ncbi:hypothetical protein RB653_010101 [Dictyostelium firmibasis]|uniref:Uncharacterized protein n=1 Tax=Dictyostelium firmibasis TaxID=79012 RepID=A0AAN7TJL3_9MYCE
MNNFMIKCVSNAVFKFIGVRRLASFAALSIGPKIVDHTVNKVSGGLIPVQVVRLLRTSLSYAPLAVVMGTTGATGGVAPVASAVTYYILVQVSETLCMLLVREATGATFRGVKYVVSSTYNTITGKDKREERMVDIELESWVFLEKEQIPVEEFSPEKVKEVENYFNSIELDRLGVDNENNNHMNNNINNGQQIDINNSYYQAKDPKEMEEILTNLNHKVKLDKLETTNIRTSNNLDDFILL